MSLFGTSGIRGPVGDVVTGDLALSVGRAVASGNGDRIVIGRDPRESGRWLLDATAAGARECGADVLDAGLVSTPTLARAVGREDADAGIVITASHNPPEDNGLKLWNPSGQGFDTAQREGLETRIETGDYDLKAWNESGSRSTVDDAIDHHVEALLGAIDPLDELSVIVDLGNGAGGVTATALEELGCAVEVMNGEPDGSFPNRPSEPTAENCTALRERVTETDADLGIAHDGDADRMRATTESGWFVSGDVLLALFARAVAGEGDRVAAPVNTSLVVDEALEPLGAEVTRTRVGDVYVAERASEPDVVFGGEPSGAWIWPAETLCPDGPLAACKLTAMVAAEGSFDGMVESVVSPHLLRTSVATDRKTAIMERIEDAVPEAYPDAERTTIDGVRIDFEEGWFLIRASGTQPLVRLTAESREKRRSEELLSMAEELVTDASPE